MYKQLKFDEQQHIEQCGIVGINYSRHHPPSTHLSLFFSVVFQRQIRHFLYSVLFGSYSMWQNVFLNTKQCPMTRNPSIVPNNRYRIEYRTSLVAVGNVIRIFLACYTKVFRTWYNFVTHPCSPQQPIWLLQPSAQQPMVRPSSHWLFGYCQRPAQCNKAVRQQLL